MTIRLGVFITHPIQYYVPLWRGLAATPGVEVLVHFFSDHSVRGSVDPDFGIPVAWDVPLLEGYAHCFVDRHADLSRPGRVALPHPHQTLKEGRFDWVMIHGYTHRFERQVVRTARALGIHTLQRGDFGDLRPFGARWYRRLFRDLYLRWFYRYVDRFCYIGEHGKRHLLRLGVPEQRLFFCPGSVDTVFLEGQRERFCRDECRRDLGIAEDQCVLMFSGKLIPRKAPLLLLDALDRLKDLRGVTLLVLGDGVLKEAFTARARQALGSRFIFPGFVNQSELARYYQAADVFVFPSLYESWGLVVNEAMQFGLPIITTSNVACQPDLVLNGETGFVVAPGDAADLARCIQRFLDDPALAARLGSQARARISGYSTDASVRGLLRALGVQPGKERS